MQYSLSPQPERWFNYRGLSKPDFVKEIWVWQMRSRSHTTRGLSVSCMGRVDSIQTSLKLLCTHKQKWNVVSAFQLWPVEDANVKVESLVHQRPGGRIPRIVQLPAGKHTAQIAHNGFAAQYTVQLVFKTQWHSEKKDAVAKYHLHTEVSTCRVETKRPPSLFLRKYQNSPNFATFPRKFLTCPPDSERGWRVLWKLVAQGYCIYVSELLK